jgi:hypothetical protein
MMFMTCISVATFGRRFIRKCVVPILIFSGEGMLGRLATQSAAVSADRQQRLNSSTRCRCRTMTHVEIRTLSMLSGLHLGDFLTSSTRIRFSVHTGVI